MAGVPVFSSQEGTETIPPGVARLAANSQRGGISRDPRLCRAASERTVVRRRQRRCPCRNVPHLRSATMKTIKFEDALKDYLEEMKRTGWYTKAYKAFVEANILKLVWSAARSSTPTRP